MIFHKIFRLGQMATVAALLYCVATVSPARAELLAYEGFNYEPGNLGNQSGGGSFGWDAQWSNSPASSQVVAGGLTYTDANGDQLQVSGNHGVTTATGSNAQPNRTLAVARDVGGTTTWLSFIAQRLQPHPTFEENLIRAANLQTRYDGSERFAVGKPTTPAPMQAQHENWGLYHTLGAGQFHDEYSTTPHLDQAFLVVRIDHQGDPLDADKAWLWVNPLLATEPNTANADAELLDLVHFSFDQMRIFTGGTTGDGPFASLAYDEIRVGTTYSSVAPIFDPSGGDFDGDGIVDGHDLLTWQRDPSLGNLSDWENNFGTGGAFESAVSAIPEPTTLGLVVLGLIGSSFVRRRRWTRCDLMN